jgi:hypothetical protein
VLTDLHEMHAEGTASSPFTLKAMCACCCYPTRRTTQRRGDWRGFEAAGRSSANCCRCNSATRFTNWLRVASDLSFGERNGMGAVGVRHDGRLKATGKKVKKGTQWDGSCWCSCYTVRSVLMISVTQNARSRETSKNCKNWTASRPELDGLQA